MPALILPRRFYSQPQGVVEVDWENPVTRGLLWAFNPASGTFYDAVGKINYAPSTITKAVSSIGVADDYSARFQPSGIAKLPASGDLSVFVQAAPNSAQQSLLCQRQGNNNNHIELRSGADLFGANTGSMFFKCSSTGQGVIGSLTLDERWHTFVGMLSGSTASLYIDGAFSNSTSITTPASDTGTLTFGGLSDSTSIPYTGLMGVVCAWTRAVSADEIAALSANPWQLFRAKPRVLYFDVGGGGTSVAPGAGAIILAGATPSISQPHTVAPAAGAAVYAGNTPTVSQAVAIAPTAGAVVVAGNTPAIAQPHTVAPTAGAAVYAGNTPQVSQGASIAPAAGSVSYSGNTPGISQPHTVAPAAGAVVMAGGVPEVSQAASIRPAAGSLVFAGNTPAISQPRTIAPSIGGYDILGNTPTVSQSALVAPTAGAIVVLGGVPAIVQPRTVATAAGAVVYAGGVPSIGVVVASVLSAPRTTYSNTQTATRSNAQTARRPRA